jgi:hypothetical protein
MTTTSHGNLAIDESKSKKMAASAASICKRLNEGASYAQDLARDPAAALGEFGIAGLRIESASVKAIGDDNCSCFCAPSWGAGKGCSSVTGEGSTTTG